MKLHEMVEKFYYQDKEKNDVFKIDIEMYFNQTDKNPQISGAVKVSDNKHTFGCEILDKKDFIDFIDEAAKVSRDIFKENFK